VTVSKYDRLVVIGTSISVSGTIVANGRLVDSDSQDIHWASNYASLEAGTGLTMTLPFTGTVINAHTRNGPYELRDLYVYHTGDPEQGVSVAEVHTTTAYNYWDFEGGMRVYLPALLKRYASGW
jgi:hypothetical protein